MGRIPRTVDCELTEDLVDSVAPGEMAVVVGVVKVTTVADARTAAKDRNMFSYYLDVVAVQNQDRTAQSNHSEPGDESSLAPGKGCLSFNAKDYTAIQVRGNSS